MKEEFLKTVDELETKIVDFKVIAESQHDKYNNELDHLDEQVVDLEVKNNDYLTSSDRQQHQLKANISKLQLETFKAQRNIKEKLKALISNQTTIDTFKDSMTNLRKNFFKKDCFIKMAANDYGIVHLEQILSSSDEFLGVGNDDGNFIIITRTKDNYLKYHKVNKHFRHLSTIKSEIKYLGEVKIKFRNKHFVVSIRDVYRVEVLDMNFRREFTTLNRFQLSLIGCDDVFVYFQSKYGSVFRYDWKLKYTDYFGQTNDKSRFYYFSTKIQQFEQKDGKYYWIGDDHFHVVDVKTGECLEYLEIKADQFQINSANQINIWTHSNEFLTLTVNNSLFVNTQSLGQLSKDLKFFLIDNVRPCFFDKEKNSFLVYNL